MLSGFKQEAESLLHTLLRCWAGAKSRVRKQACVAFHTALHCCVAFLCHGWHSVLSFGTAADTVRPSHN
jgi:hypothetical protein